jgi:hypothetical protein
MFKCDCKHGEAAEKEWSKYFHRHLNSQRGSNLMVYVKIHKPSSTITWLRMAGYTQKQKDKRWFVQAWLFNISVGTLQRAFEAWWMVRLLLWLVFAQQWY